MVQSPAFWFRTRLRGDSALPRFAECVLVSPHVGFSALLRCADLLQVLAGEHWRDCRAVYFLRFRFGIGVETFQPMILTLLLIMLCFQSAEPEYAGVFYLYADGNRSELERQTGQIKAKGNILTSSAKGYFTVPGKKSPVRFAPRRTTNFLIRVSSTAHDPKSQIQLLSFESKGDSRRALVSEVSSGGFRPKVSVRALSGIDYDVEKFGASSFKITLNQGLPAGEYCFRSGESATLFCFGYDK
jgi:hypothetical protein